MSADSKFKRLYQLLEAEEVSERARYDDYTKSVAHFIKQCEAAQELKERKARFPWSE
jgi:hypothetical protein